MKILITGSRGYRKLDQVSSFLSCLQSHDVVFVGDARGVDITVINYHISHPDSFKLEVFKANWDLHGIKAGIVRNLEMLDKVPNYIVAFWDGQSRGTKFVIDAALRRCINIRINFDLV